MNSNRLRARRLDEPDRGGRRRAPPVPGNQQDRTGLYVGLGVGGAVLIVALAFAMSSGSSAPATAERTSDQNLKQELESAQKLAQVGKLDEAVRALDAAIQDPAYRRSKLLPDVKKQADQWRKRIAHEREAAVAIDDFERRVNASKDDKTAMKKADAFWAESTKLLEKYSGTAKTYVVKNLRSDLERWRSTGAQDVWLDDYNRTKARIQAQHIDTGNFSQAVKDWRQFSQPFDDPVLRSRVETELRAIDHVAKAAAEKLVQSAGTGPMAREKLQAELVKFMETEGQKIITAKLRTLQ